MTAEEARKATKAGKKIKGWQELDMMWICGRINHAIEKACRKGLNKTEVYIRNFRTSWFIKEIEHTYTEMGYCMYSRTSVLGEKIIFKISWE